MGVGYQVSALHKISYIEPIEGAAPTKPPPDWLMTMPNAQWDGRPTRFVSPAVSDIIAWRNGIGAKYRRQLGEALSWDEASGFSVGGDTATSWDLDFRYVAAVLELHDVRSAAKLLKGREHPKPEQYHPVFDAVEKRGFTGRFPQLLLGADYWLPFQRNMIIEEPSWRGDVERFGSTIRLMEEIVHIRHFIRSADPTALTVPEDDDQNVLSAAWKAADMVHRLGTLAVRKHLPLWTTG